MPPGDSALRHPLNVSVLPTPRGSFLQSSLDSKFIFKDRVFRAPLLIFMLAVFKKKKKSLQEFLKELL